MQQRTSQAHVNADRQMYGVVGKLAALGVGIGVVVGLGGCLSQDDRTQMAKENSILAPVFHQMSPAEAAAWAADPYDADKRARGMNMLANAPWGGAEAYVKMYRERLKDDNAPVRAVACRALALHGNTDDVPKIVPLTKAEELLVRLEATRALQRLYNPVAVPALIDRVNIDKEAEPEIRAEAASALGQYAEGPGMQALITALADPSLLVNRSAHESLRTLTGNDELPADRKMWVNWAKDTKKPFANRRAYVYPVFKRDSRWMDYLPFAGPVPNETPSTPVGFPVDEVSGGSVAPASAPSVSPPPAPAAAPNSGATAAKPEEGGFTPAAPNKKN